VDITSNILDVIVDLGIKFKELASPESVSRASAMAVMPELRERIHVSGEASDGSKIGEYSNAYLKLRQSKYNRTSDKAVIASLTRQLENSYVLSADEKGYSIGVATPLSEEKIQWLTDKYGLIWQLTDNEKQIAFNAAIETTNKILGEP
jgi:hypothetical protein